MKKDSISVLTLPVALTASFLLGIIFTNLAIDQGVVHVSENEQASLTVDLKSATDKRLVPPGKVTNPEETEEVYLTYKVVAKNLRLMKRLNVNVTSIVDEKGRDVSGFLTGTEERTSYFQGSKDIVFRIRMVEPADDSEYYQIASKEILLTFNFWID